MTILLINLNEIMNQQLRKAISNNSFRIISFANLYLLLIICGFILDYYFILISLVHIDQREIKKKLSENV